MTRNNKILRIILLTIFGTWFAYKLYKTTQDDFFLDGIILFVIALVGLLIFIWTIREDSKGFKTSRKMTCYVPTSIGLLFILTNVGLFYYQDSKTNSPTLISGFYDGGFNGFSVDFKTDGNYVMANGSGLGQSYFYGTYSIKDSIITIDKSNIDNCIKTNKLVIRTENYYPKDSVDLLKSKANYITQVDDNGIEIDKEFRFRVTEDNRINTGK
ncbi:MAG: hypothetical protein QY319_09515 [Candidatus Kapaibacterium sp.]|nr:MAG: hypothetical protein QY319_09515 [Candidatus Kapabacteria bacterium]